MTRSKSRIHRVRLDPLPESLIEEPIEDSPSAAAGCLVFLTALMAILAGLGAFVTGVAALIMAFRHGGSQAGLYLIAAALAFGSLVYAFFRGL